jgi:hypothetical protein
MEIVGRDCYGVIPLRGVIRNVRPAKVNAKVLKDFLKNTELAAINKVLASAVWVDMHASILARAHAHVHARHARTHGQGTHVRHKKKKKRTCACMRALRGRHARKARRYARTYARKALYTCVRAYIHVCARTHVHAQSSWVGSDKEMRAHARSHINAGAWLAVWTDVHAR